MTNPCVIVDTCVATSVGDPTDQQYVDSRRIITHIDLRAVRILMTDDLHEEWGAHASRFMKKWYAKMVSKGRVRFEPDRKISDYRKVLIKFQATDGYKALLKDAHIVEAAIWHGLGVISLDGKQRSLLVAVGSRYDRVGRLQWFNPSSHVDECVTWIDGGCTDSSLCRIIPDE